MHILEYLNIILQIILDLQLLTFQITQFELTELLYTIQKTIPVFQFLQNALLQITTHYLTREKKQNSKDSKLLI